MIGSLADEASLHVERGGPAYRLLHRIRVIQGDGPSTARSIVTFVAVVWVPLLVFSLLEGRAIGPTPRESFLLDFAAYARFFVALPILIAADAVVGPRLTTAGLQFARAGFVRPEDYPSFHKAAARVARWRESLWAELFILGIVLLGSWVLTIEHLYGTTVGTTATWSAVLRQGSQISPAGLWYHVISIPIFQFLWYRWLWRLIIWSGFLLAISKLNLNLVPTHADEAGGLGFLGVAHASLGLLAFAFGSVLSADAGFRMVFEGARIEMFKVPFVVLVGATEVLFLGPLLLFMPTLMRTRREYLRTYGMLVVDYNRAFHQKWVERKGSQSESFLGSGDIQSLADMGNAFRVIADMNFVPFAPRVMLQLLVAAALPGLPLLLLAVPVKDILNFLEGAIF